MKKDTSNIIKYILSCEIDWMSNSDFQYFLNRQIEQGDFSKTEFKEEFELAINDTAFDWTKITTENGLFKEYGVNPIKGKRLSTEILIKTLNSIYWDDINEEKPKQDEIDKFKFQLEKYRIKVDQSIESVMSDLQFEDFSFPLKNKMNFYLGEKELRDKDVIYFLKSIGGKEYFPIIEESSIQIEDKSFILNLLYSKKDWTDLDEIVEVLNKSKTENKIDMYYVQNLVYHKNVVIMRHNKYEIGSSYIKIKTLPNRRRP